MNRKQRMKAQQESKKPQPSCHEAGGGDLKDGGKWKQVPAQGGRRILSWPPLPSQVPLQNRFEALDLEGQADNTGEEGLSGGSSRSMQSTRWITNKDGLENVQQKKTFKENKKKTQQGEEPRAADSVDSLMAEMPFVDTDIEDECSMHATTELNIKKKRKRTTGREIEEGIWRKKIKNKPYQPNYFISLPITNPEITGSIQAVQDAIIQKDQRLSKAMVRSGSLHVTMLVMHLSNEEEISIAVGALSDSKVFVDDLLKGKRVDLSFQGIDHFRNQVGFVNLAENDHTTILKEIAETMKKIFQEKGILAGEERAFKPHLTFMKLSKSIELCKQIIQQYEKQERGSG